MSLCTLYNAEIVFRMLNLLKVSADHCEHSEDIDCSVGDINAPHSTLSIQQVVISQAGAAPDGSGDLTLGTLSATAPASGSPTLVLQAATGTSAGAPCKHTICRLLHDVSWGWHHAGSEAAICKSSSNTQL